MNGKIIIVNQTSYEVNIYDTIPNIIILFIKRLTLKKSNSLNEYKLYKLICHRFVID